MSLPLQFITHPTNFETIEEQVESVCLAGIRWVQLRLKDKTESEFLATAYRVKKICDSFGALLIINDNVSIAKTINASGIHLGKSDLSPLKARDLLGDNAIIGSTANSFEDIKALATLPINYIGCGPLKFTSTKKVLSPCIGIEGYSSIIDQLKSLKITIPVVAIGGIELSDISSLRKTGINGIAFSGLLVNSTNRKATVKAIQQNFTD